MITLGVIVAMDEELRLLKNSMESVESIEVGGSVYYKGNLNGCSAVLVCCGVGKVNAAVCASVLCLKFQVKYVINSGVAGAVSGDLRPFDVVLSSEFVAHDVTPRISESYFPNRWVFPADPGLLDDAVTACRRLKIERVFTGRIATGDIYVDDSAVKADIDARTSPLCVEMEGQAIAQVCCIYQIPFVAIRSISDSADDNSNVDFAQFVQKASDISASIVLSTAAMLKA